MKIKKFNESQNTGNVYYKVFIDGSSDNFVKGFNNFLVALDKLGVEEEKFLEDWCLISDDWIGYDLDELSNENKKHFHHKMIYLLITDENFYVRNDYEDFLNMSVNVDLGSYKGEVHITQKDIEIYKLKKELKDDTKKYNL